MEPVESKELVLGRDFFIRVLPKDVIVGKDYYIEKPQTYKYDRKFKIIIHKFIGRIINKYYREDGGGTIVLNDINGKYEDPETQISLPLEDSYGINFYEVKKPDIINNFEKKAYEDVLSNKLSRVDTRTGERVHESLGPEVIDSVKMFGGKRKRKSKSKRRKSYRRRKSRKNKR